MKKSKFNLFKSLDSMATEITIREIMVEDIKTIKEDDTVQKAIDKMSKHAISGLIVIDDSQFPVGIVSEGDMFKKVFTKGKNPKKMQVKEIMSESLSTIEPDIELGKTVNLMKKKGIGKLPVVENHKLVGYVTKSDLVEKLNEIYYQNTHVRWLFIIIVAQLIGIALLILAYVNK